MPNLYGVSNSPNFLVQVQTLIGGGNITPSLGVETNIMDSGAMVAPSQGWFYPIVWLTLCWQANPAVPSGFNLATRIGGGADFDYYVGNVIGTVTNQVFDWSIQFTGVPSQVAWQGAGSHIFVTALVNGGLILIPNTGAKAIFGLIRAPDQ